MSLRGPRIIRLLDNQTISSGAAGAERLYYSDDADEDSGMDTAVVIACLEVVAALTSDVDLAVFGYWSMNGRTWKVFDKDVLSYKGADYVSGELKRSVPDVPTAADGMARLADLGIKVRYAVAIKGRSASSIVSATINAAVILRGWTFV